MPIEVKRVHSTMTKGDLEPHWFADVDYGAFEVTIQLPARCLVTDDAEMQHRQFCEGLESLGKALLRFADHTRK